MNNDIQEVTVRKIPRGKLDLLTLHRQLLEIDSAKELSKQEKTAQSLELLTLLTNSSASAYFYADISNALAVGPRVVSKQTAQWDEDILPVLHQAAKASLELGRVYIDKLDKRPDVTILAAPGFEENGRHCAVTQLLQLNSEPIESFAVILQLFVAILGKRNSGDAPYSYSKLNYIQASLESPSLVTAQKKLINNLSSRYPDLVAWIGSVKRNTVKFGAISINSPLNNRSLFISKLTQAMVECLKQNQVLKFSDIDQSKCNSPIIQEAFKALANKYFCLIPVTSTKGKVVEVIGMSSNNPTDFHAAVIEIDTEKHILGDVFSQKPYGLFGFYRETKARIIDSSNRWLKPCVIGLPIVLTGLLLFPITYKIETPVVIEPVERRFISAPFNSVLKEILVKPGDVVKQGQIVAELDDRELKWKYSQLEAEFERANKRKDIEMAKGDTAKMQLSKYVASQYQAKIELLKYKLENLKLTSPIDGQFVSGDIEKRKGSAISIGETLFEIAPLDKVMLELEVPANDISYVKKEMPVKIRINALPYEKLSSSIETIHLRSALRQGENVFIAKLTLQNSKKLMRPGMDGKAKIYSDKKSLAWVLFHRAWNKLIEISFW